MATIRQIITDAYREGAIIGIEETLDTEKFAEGLRRFNVLFDSLFDNELGEALVPVNYGINGMVNPYALGADNSAIIDDMYLPSNYRMIVNISEATTIYLDPNPRDGARVAVADNSGNLATYNLTLNGNGRKIEAAASVTLSTNSLVRQWFYRGDTANWVKVVDFIDGDSSPFPDEFDDFLVMLLAVRLNPRHGATTSPEMIEALKRSRRAFRHRYRQSKFVRSELGLLRLTGNKTLAPRDRLP